MVDASHLAGWLLVVGPVMFGIAAGNPYLVRAWTAPRETFLAIVAGHPAAWRFSHVLFMSGSVITAAGLAALVVIVPDGWPRSLAVAGALAFAIGTVLWVISLIYRMAVVPGSARAFVDNGLLDPRGVDLDLLNGGLFAAFIIIAFAGLAAIGIAITAGGPIPAPLGWGAAAFSGLCLAGLVLAGDMPPFTVYLAPLAFGTALLVAS
jgi:hypothetical protein